MPPELTNQTAEEAPRSAPYQEQPHRLVGDQEHVVTRETSSDTTVVVIAAQEAGTTTTTTTTAIPTSTTTTASTASVTPTPVLTSTTTTTTGSAVTARTDTQPITKLKPPAETKLVRKFAGSKTVTTTTTTATKTVTPISSFSPVKYHVISSTYDPDEATTEGLPLIPVSHHRGAAIAIPSVLAILALGIVGLFLCRMRRKRKGFFKRKSPERETSQADQEVALMSPGSPTFVEAAPVYAQVDRSRKKTTSSAGNVSPEEVFLMTSIQNDSYNGPTPPRKASILQEEITAGATYGRQSSQDSVFLDNEVYETSGFGGSKSSNSRDSVRVQEDEGSSDDADSGMGRIDGATGQSPVFSREHVHKDSPGAEQKLKKEAAAKEHDYVNDAVTPVSAPPQSPQARLFPPAFPEPASQPTLESGLDTTTSSGSHHGNPGDPVNQSESDVVRRSPPAGREERPSSIRSLHLYDPVYMPAVSNRYSFPLKPFVDNQGYVTRRLRSEADAGNVYEEISFDDEASGPIYSAIDGDEEDDMDPQSKGAVSAEQLMAAATYSQPENTPPHSHPDSQLYATVADDAIYDSVAELHPGEDQSPLTEHSANPSKGEVIYVNTMRTVNDHASTMPSPCNALSEESPEGLCTVSNPTYTEPREAVTQQHLPSSLKDQQEQHRSNGRLDDTRETPSDCDDVMHVKQQGEDCLQGDQSEEGVRASMMMREGHWYPVESGPPVQNQSEEQYDDDDDPYEAYEFGKSR